ncbi:MAG TPA: ATPase [Chloroflexi bacterium]|nr:ATPase [Chloroflexota bacterium]
MVVAALVWAVRSAAHPAAALRRLVGGLLSLNGLVLLVSVAVILISLSSPMTVLAQEEAAAGGTTSGVALGAALATGLACIGAGIAVGIAGAAAIGGITEKPEILGRTLIFVGLAEGIAIYGLIISFMILSQ